MKRKALIYIILAGILWGTSGIFVHYLTPLGFTSFQMTAVRATVSLISIFLYAVIRDRALLKAKPKDMILFAAIGISLYLTAACYYLSMQLASVSTAVVLMYSAPIYVSVFSVIFMKDKLSVSKLVAIALLLIGCCLVAGIVGGLKLDTVGLLVGAASGISYAAYNILTKISLKRGANAVTVTLYGFLFMALISLIGLEPVSLAERVSASPEVAIPLLLLLGICTFVLPYFLYTLAMRSFPVGVATALGTVEPMAATLFSVIIFGERLTVFSAFGIILILSALVIIGLADDEKKNKEIIS